MKRFAALLLACALAFLVTGCDRLSEVPKFQSTDITGADFGKSLALTDPTGKPRTLDDFKGKAVVLFFGYTQCPDVCPTTLSEMAQAVKALGADAAKVQVLFATVDPERDTPQLLAQYVTAFDPSFIGLYGDAAATEKATREFKIYVEKKPAKNGGYTVDHSAGIFIFDTAGRLRLYAQPTLGAPALTADIRTLLKQAA